MAHELRGHNEDTEAEKQYFARYADTPRGDVVDFLRPHGPWSTALEIGCGAGATLTELKRRKMTETAFGLELERSVVDRVYALTEARAAHETSESGHVAGKLVIEVMEDASRSRPVD